VGGCKDVLDELSCLIPVTHADMDSILARQRRIVDRAFGIEARKKSRKSSKSLPLGADAAEKKPDFKCVVCHLVKT
jgi:hypothetical protein